ncbi:amino acid adenylation domain-containing protein [Paenibacillus kandeliae]|uniref:amino acid adenylation domain-containing protein n=1 Tax=Paenibacillus kandeliae TaxID=3231269 RepID=UPI003459942C
MKVIADEQVTPFQTVLELFDMQVQQHSEQRAIEDEHQAFTYRQLDEYSDRIAASLQQRGIQPGARVGTLMERSVYLFACWLGILKVGATYVPVDPANPSERIAYIIEDSEMSLLIADSSVGDWFAGSEAAYPCEVVEMQHLHTEQPYVSLDSHSYRSDSIAYMIYTSGSTGRPKGVCIQDKGIVSLVQHASYAQLDHTDVMAQASNASFDAVTFELWGALLHGARLVIAPREQMLSAEHFAAWLSTNQITTLFITVAWFNQMARQQPGAFAQLKTVLFGGEACNVRWVNEVIQAGKPQHLSNIYGPTECTTFSLSYEIPDGLWDEQQKMPIGQPINHTTAYVLDDQQRLLPVGVVGELYLGGDGLATGYWNRPELTTEKFVHLPHLADEPLYRTGDLVQWRTDGQMEFIGRTDDQVKLRGHRIELGEVEEALRMCTGVHDAVALLTQAPGQEENILAVYYTTDMIQNIAVLREQLSQRLPAYMLPSAWKELPAFALTVNGKIDRKQLPAIEEQDLRQQAYEAPDRPGEQIIADIWQQILGREQIGAYDHFFAIGGHSLLAAQVVSRLEEALQRQLSLRMLFDYPVLRELAEQIQKQPVLAASDPIVAYRSPDGKYPLSPAQQRLWLVQQLEPDSKAYHIPFAFHLYGAVDGDRLEQAIHTILNRHDSLRTIFGEERGEPYQQVTTQLVSLERSTIYDAMQEVTTDRQEFLLQDILEQEAWQPLSLTDAPPLRLRLIEMEPEHHVLSWVIHHILFDGWSVGILQQELEAAYRQLDMSTKPMLQYSDYACWQHEPAQQQRQQQQLSYWLEELGGELPVLELATEYRRPKVPSSEGRSLHCILSPELTERLRSWSQEQEATLPMTLLAAFQVLLHRHSGQKELLIGMPVAGRARAEWEALIGFFVNTVVIRTTLADDPAFAHYVQQVKEKCLGAYAHQDVSFERIVEAIQPERQRSYHPVFQVMFIHHHDLSRRDTDFIQAMEVSASSGQSEQAKFDLTLSIHEHVEGMEMQFRYRTDVLTDHQVEQMAEHMTHLLYQITVNGNEHISRISLIPEADRQSWSEQQYQRLRSAAPESRTIYQMLEQQMLQHPADVALDDTKQTMTYGELHTRSEQLAFYLSEVHGIQRHDRIGLYFHKSFDAVVAMLAVWKMGACIVPIDPTYPEQRQQYMAEHAAPRCILTSTLQVPHAQSIVSIPVIAADYAVYANGATGAITAASSGDAAYIVYTSGSTGNPKAICNEHTGICNYIAFMKKELHVQSSDRVLQLASLSVDAFFRDLIAPLALGATVVLLPPQHARDQDLILQMIRQKEITCLLSTVPSLLKSLTLTAHHTANRPSSVRLVLCSGEMLSDTLAASVQQLFPFSQLINLYGPTETTLTTTYRRIGTQPEPVYDVGQPIEHTAIYILDENQLPVPDGLIGEVYIGGRGMSRGYIGDEQQTAEHFVHLPWAEESLTFYRTGDRGYIRENGNLALKGRQDRQVKVRGYRIELNEVESMLSAHPAVDTAIVVVRQDQDQQAELEGYVLLQHSFSEYTLDQIVDELKSKFPSHLIPSSMFRLQSIPLTPNGKVDRKQLKQHLFPAVSVSTMLPIDDSAHHPRQQQLIGIWEEVLQYDGITLNDNFFMIGGHSLLAAQVISRIRQQFEVDIPLAALFDYPTVLELDRQFEQIASQPALQLTIRRHARGNHTDRSNPTKG